MSRSLTHSIITGTALMMLLIVPLGATEFGPTSAAASKGLFIALNLPRISVDGDFDGTRRLLSSNEAVAVPRLPAKFAIAFALGYRWHRGAVEFSYSRTGYHAEWMGYPLSADAQTYSLDFRGYSGSFLIASHTAQAFVQSGFSVVPLKVKDAAYAKVGRQEKFGDASFAGFGITFVGGVEAAVSRRISLSLGAGYRLLRYISCAGVLGNNAMIQDGLKGNGFMTTVSASFLLL